MAKTFSQMDVDDVRNLVSRDYDQNAFQANEDYYGGNHWRLGKGLKSIKAPKASWIGGVVDDGLATIFTSRNIIAEVCNRRKNAVVSRPPRLTVMTDVDSGPPIDKQESLKKWFKDQCAIQEIKKAVLWSCLHEQSVLRLRVPPGLLVKGKLTGRDIDEVMSKIYVQAHKRNQARVYQDRDSARDIGCIIFDAPDDDLPVLSDKGTTQDSAEISYVDQDGKTILKTIYQDDTANQSVSMDLGGLLTMYQIDQDPFITQSVRDQQEAFNTAETQLGFSNHETNFQQRVFLNAQPPGTEIIDKDTGKATFKVGTLERGSDKDVFVAGITLTGTDGERRIMPVDVKTIEPGTAQRYLDTCAFHKRNILSECRQLHMELTDDATSTGEARMQASADHEQDVNEFKEPIEKAVLWLLNAVWRMGHHYLGKAPDESEILFELVIDLGPIAASRSETARQQSEGTSPIISKRTARQQLGISDPREEGEQIRKEQKEDLKALQMKAEMVADMARSGVSNKVIEAITGVSMPEDPPPPELTSNESLPINENEIDALSTKSVMPNGEISKGI
jgi:hypothetical protein